VDQVRAPLPDREAQVEGQLAQERLRRGVRVRERPGHRPVPELAVGQWSAHLVHGSPRKVNEYLFEDKPARLYERLAAAEDGDALVFGHTHWPWVRDFGGVRFVNCGSVGKPKDGDPRAAFAVLEGGQDALNVRIERVAYDAHAVAREVAAAGLPHEYAEKLVLAA
jgi:diadenosine tetraphosphatase ApaH/serine/threonine PP2A family protein phosphatase